MKNFLFFVLLVCLQQLNAQCPLTINGTTVVCSGSCTILSGSGGTSYTWSANAGSASSYSVSVCPTVSTTYTLTAATGTCTATQTITVIVNQLPNVVITNTNTAICLGSSTCFYAGGAQTYSWSPATGLSITAGSSNCASPPSTINYTVTGSDMNGCVNTATLTIGVLPTPTANFTMTPNGTPHVWDVTANFSGGTGGFNYHWDWGDGGTDATAYPSHTYTTGGWYNICATITDANGCTANVCQNDSLYKVSSANSMITVNVVSGSAGVKQLKNSQLSLYPNPASNYITIQSSTEIGIIIIYNSLGEIVLQTKSIISSAHNISPTVEKSITIDISKLPIGIYIVQTQGRYVKMIKE